MSDEQTPVTLRLYETMLHLNAARDQGATLELPPPRGVVQEVDALEAVSGLGAAIQEAHDAQELPVNRAALMASLLMVVRDYLQPLPPQPVDRGETDLVTKSLIEMVDGLRRYPTDHG